MANVKFLKGTQEKFNTLHEFTDGAFYLTTDTDRLYFAQSETECVPLNQFIRTVTWDQFNALTTTQVAKGDYYYVPEKNILAVCKDNNTTLTWTQLNPDTNDNTTFNEINFGGSVADNTVTITETLKEYNALTDTQTGNKLVGNLKLKGTNGIALTAENTDKSTTITVEGDTYSLSSNMDDARQYEAGKAYHVGDIIVINGKYQRCKAEVSAEQNKSAAAIVGSFEPLNAGISLVSANGQESSTFGFKAGDNVTIGQIDGQITVSATDTTLKEKDGFSISNNATQGFDIKVSDTSNTVVGGTLDPIIKVGSSGSSSAHFVNGAAELPVYTTSEIDSKFKGLNGMTYKGTVGTAALQNLPTSNVSSGDTYMVAANTTVNAQAVKKGDLFIATGTEGADGYIASDGITWTHVPSGDDNYQNSTYEGNATPESNKWGIKEVSGSGVGDIQLVAGTNMSISSKLGGKDGNSTAAMITTINHGSVGAASVTEATVNDTSDIDPKTTITAVTGIGRDSNGHVASVTTKQFNIQDTKYTFGAEVKDNKIVTKLTDSDNNPQAVKYGVTSSSLNVTTTAAATNDVTVNVELQWGSF